MKNERQFYPVLPYFLVNSLTLSRAALGLGSTIAYSLKDPVTTSILIVIGIATDIVDGPLAKRFHVNTPQGAMRDALADTILLTAAAGYIGTNLDTTGTGCSLVFVSAFAIMGAFYALSLGKQRVR